MIVKNRQGSVHCSYSSYDCRWYVVERGESDIFYLLYCDSIIVEKFDTEDGAVNCLDIINQKWLDGCDVYQIE